MRGAEAPRPCVLQVCRYDLVVDRRARAPRAKVPDGVQICDVHRALVGWRAVAPAFLHIHCEQGDVHAIDLLEQENTLGAVVELLRVALAPIAKVRLDQRVNLIQARARQERWRRVLKDRGGALAGGAAQAQVPHEGCTRGWGRHISAHTCAVRSMLLTTRTETVLAMAPSPSLWRRWHTHFSIKSPITDPGSADAHMSGGRPAIGSAGFSFASTCSDGNGELGALQILGADRRRIPFRPP